MLKGTIHVAGIGILSPSLATMLALAGKSCHTPTLLTPSGIKGFA